MKLQTIPRLELSSALLLAHVYVAVSKSNPSSFEAYFWTDSMIVLYWLASIPSRWQMFVANRVSEVQHLTKKGQWSHVPGIDNPADLISRGATPEQLKNCSLWWSGSSWMLKDKSSWPTTIEVSRSQVDEALLEENVQSDQTVAAVVNIEEFNAIFTRTSSFHTLVNIVAWWIRFKDNTLQADRSKRRIGPLTHADREEAIRRLTLIAQRECFGQEIADLSRREEVKTTSRIVSLNPRLVDGIIRVGGRLENAPISANRKHPIIFDINHPLSLLILRHYHKQLLHAGQQLLIASVREIYWILSIRSLARRVIHDCVTCFRNKPSVQEQLMADLPAIRVTPAPPFLRVGVDYCGPFQVNYPIRKRVMVKYFAAIFVCLVTIAVHIEMVGDLTTMAFISALKRFTGRRGIPEVIMCDNATNFVGARRKLDELQQLFMTEQAQKAIVSTAADKGIEFRFIPPKVTEFRSPLGGCCKIDEAPFKKDNRFEDRNSRRIGDHFGANRSVP
ncbi:uncharacterized protein LOC134202148 [Armigeres subalbatus]|uniref:uncharacterized protein LOC134202148 n=1 Tax=Armigeres subalbatus TaxID=124917 RepID=UPI002ECFCC88